METVKVQSGKHHGGRASTLTPPVGNGYDDFVVRCWNLGSRMISLLRAYFSRMSARKLEDKGRWEAAAARYEVLRRSGAARPSDLVRHAKAVEAAGRLEAALPIHQENAVTFPLEPNIHRQMGLYQLRMGDEASASLAFARARVLAFDDAVLKSDLERLGFDDAMTRQLAVAAFYAASAPKLRGRSVLSKVMARRAAKAAKALRHDGHWAEALTAQRRVLRYNPYNSAAHVRLGHVLKETRQVEAAESAYWASVAVSPQNADAYLQLGHLLRSAVGKEIALPAYLLTWRLAPNHREVDEALSGYGLSGMDAAQLIETLGLLDPKRAVEQLKSALEPTAIMLRDTHGAGPVRRQSRYIDIRAVAVAGDIARVVGTIR